jgi:hypothetical protein
MEKVENVVTDAEGNYSMTEPYVNTNGYWAIARFHEVVDSGTVSSSPSTTSLTDTTKTWDVDEFGGSEKKFMVKCTPTVGDAEERTILSNSGDTLQWDRAFSFTIDDSVTYEIVELKSGSTKYFPPQA